MALYRTAIDKLVDYIEKFEVKCDIDADIKLGLQTAIDVLRVDEHTEYVYVLAAHKNEPWTSYIQSVYNTEQDAINNLNEIAEQKCKYSENYNAINFDIKNKNIYTKEGDMQTRYMIHRIRIL